jgi:hypothetical protein
MNSPLSNGDIAFMDDIALSATADSDEQLSPKLQVKLDKIALWALKEESCSIYINSMCFPIP